MITLIAGTNRANSRSLHVAHVYFQLLQDMDVPAQIFSLTQLKSIARDADFINLEAEFLLPAEKFIFIVPEYNGSFPGVLKLLIDNSDIRKVWHYKKALLTGIADGRAGNLRGLDNLTNILHYLKMDVYYDKIPLSRISQEMDTEGKMLMSETIDTIKAQIEGFVKW